MISIVRQQQAIHVLADALFSRAGIITGIAPKIFAMSHASCAVAVTGSESVARSLGPCLASSSWTEGPISLRVASFEAAVQLLPVVIDVCAGTQPEVLADICDKNFRIVLAGYSEARRRFEAYEFPGSGGLAGAAVVPIEAAIACVPRIEFPALGWQPPDDLEQFQPEFHGLLLLEAQRRQCAAGGFIQLATVKPDQVISTVLRRWPDRISDRLPA